MVRKYNRRIGEQKVSRDLFFSKQNTDRPFTPADIVTEDAIQMSEVIELPYNSMSSMGHSNTSKLSARLELCARNTFSIFKCQFHAVLNKKHNWFNNRSMKDPKKFPLFVHFHTENNCARTPIVA